MWGEDLIGFTYLDGDSDLELPGMHDMQGSSRLMILNDDSHEILRMRDAFKEADWDAEIQEVHSGRDAIITLRRNHLKTTPADLVICSSRVDGESLLYFLRVLRVHPNINRQPLIVFSTGSDDDFIINSCNTFGVMKYYPIADGGISFSEMLIDVRSHFFGTGNLIRNGTRGHWNYESSALDDRNSNTGNMDRCISGTENENMIP
jgi:hypothetical protein